MGNLISHNPFYVVSPPLFASMHRMGTEVFRSDLVVCPLQHRVDSHEWWPSFGAGAEVFLVSGVGIAPGASVGGEVRGDVHGSASIPAGRLLS